MRCIYCLEDKPSDEFKNREHVLPQCYGTFTPNNLILNQTVCDKCNQYFGDNIELHLGRDTIEGIQRYRHGIKSSGKPKHERLKFKIDEGELRGIIVTPIYSGIPNEIDIEPVLQVGFFKNDEQKYVYFEPEDIPPVKELKKQGYEMKGKNIKLIEKNDKEREFLLKILKERGMHTKLEDRQEWPEDVKKRKKVLIKITARIGLIIYRGIAKIAFNYLTYIERRDLALSEEFNGIRNFIRYGKGNSNDYFAVNQPPILYDDRRLKRYNMRVTNGHLVTIEWRGLNLISQVSIFNMNTYLVKLCSNYKTIWRPIASGHHFDVKTKEVSKLIVLNPRFL